MSRKNSRSASATYLPARLPVIFPAAALFTSLAASGTASAIEFQAGNTVIDIYGFAKLDVIYDVDADLGSAVTPGNIGLDGADVAEGFTRIQAPESRLGVSTTSATPLGDVEAVIEGDFFGANNTLRLRQAYGEWNGILAGQTWSNFTTFVGFTPTLDFTGQPGLTVLNRQAQLRFNWRDISVALESPTQLGGALLGFDETLGEAGEFENVQQGQLPDLTLRYELDEGPFTFAVSGLLRRIGFDDGDQSDHSTGYGLALAAGFEVVPGISVQGNVVYGDGIGGYLYVAPGPAGFVDNDGNVETVEQIGGAIGVSAQVGEGTVNLAYGVAYADWDDAEDAFAADTPAGIAVGESNERFQSVFINYIWTPDPRVTYGIEAGYHTRRVVTGVDGDAVRLQASASYSF